MSFDLDQITAKVQEKHTLIDGIYQQISRQVVGQRYMIERLIMGLLAGGHILLEGVPGLAKTTTVNALASCLRSNFKRIQFTPDLMPSDLVGTSIYNLKTNAFEFKKGPLFSNIVLTPQTTIKSPHLDLRLDMLIVRPLIVYFSSITSVPS